MEILSSVGFWINMLIVIVTAFISYVIKTIKKEQKDLREYLKIQDKNLLSIIREQDKSLKAMLKEFKENIKELYDRTDMIFRHDEQIKNLEKRVNGK